jgi:uncharacterized membrane protein YeaQ/YmgE (transglycosylase-associated protein family)
MKPMTLYMAGIVVLTLIGVAGLAAVEILRPGDYNTAIVNQIIGFVGTSIAALILFIRQAAGEAKVTEKVEAAKHELKQEVQAVAPAVATTAATVAATVAADTAAAGIINLPRPR